jgi:hypothetical protein
MVPRGWEGYNKENNICIENIFSRTSRPISVKLGTNHPWVKRIKYSPIEGPGSLPRGENHKNAKMGSGH